MKSRPRHDSTLLWQALLVVLPLAILSGVALYFLREDRASIEQEARERANVLAPELAQRLGPRVGDALGRESKQQTLFDGVIGAGRILSPPDYPRLPEPADWPAQMTSDQARLWRSAQQAIFQRHDLGAARKALESLRTTGGPSAVRANAEYGLLLIEAGRGHSPALRKQFIDLARNYPGVLTESGAPLPDLALLVALRGGFLPDVVRVVQEHPSFLTPELVEAAERAATKPKDVEEVYALKEKWLARETTLTLLRVLLQRPPDTARPGAVWLEADARFLALCTPVRNATQVTLVPARLVEQAFADALKGSPARLPAYGAVAVEIGGERWRIAGASQRGVLLASAAGRLELRSAHPFTISLELAEPELLYAPYRRRLWLTAALILLAAATGFAGLVSLWRGYRRQARLSEMKSNFVSSVSHELRAPIAAVRLMAESLDAGRIADDAKKRDYFRLIVQECRRLSSLVENVLDFSRIDQGRKRYSLEPVDLWALVQQTAALMEPCAAQQRVRLELAAPTPESESLQPCWDGEAIQQALVNLLDNAIKHSPAGATVGVRVEVVKDFVHLWVEDQGEGIPAAEQARIFELFYRRGSELRRETKGVGIGLSIVKHIAEAHGGRVIVESAVGQGSRFALELPLAPLAAKETS
jgi:signal transduction histidine kinase